MRGEEVSLAESYNLRGEQVLHFVITLVCNVVVAALLAQGLAVATRSGVIRYDIMVY